MRFAHRIELGQIGARQRGAVGVADIDGHVHPTGLLRFLRLTQDEPMAVGRCLFARALVRQGFQLSAWHTRLQQLTVAGVTRAWVSAENVLGIEEDVGALGAASVQAAAKTQKPMTTYRMCCLPAGLSLGSRSQ